MDTVTRVQIMDEVFRISHNTFRKSKDFIMLSPAMGK